MALDQSKSDRNTPLQSAKFEPVPLTDALLSGEPDPEAAARELDQWERFALKRLGKSQPRAFEVRHLPSELAFELSAQLLAAITAADIQAAFAAARSELSTSNGTINRPTDL